MPKTPRWIPGKPNPMGYPERSPDVLCVYLGSNSTGPSSSSWVDLPFDQEVVRDKGTFSFAGGVVTFKKGGTYLLTVDVTLE